MSGTRYSSLPARTKPMSRGSGFQPKPVTESRAAAGRKTSPRDTGPDRRTRFLVYEREGLRCASCGTYLGSETCWRSIQHRKARGVGGGNELENLILLCGSATSPGCHRKAEDRDPEMHARGYWLRSDEDPALVPVMLFEESGSGMTVWLTADGGYSTEPPQAGAA